MIREEYMFSDNSINSYGIAGQVAANTAGAVSAIGNELIDAALDIAKEKLASKFGALQGGLESIKEESISDSNHTGMNELAIYAKKCGASSGAAAMAAVMDGSANILACIDDVRAGKMDIKEATAKVIGETITSAANSALNAAGETGRALLCERYGSEKGAIEALARQGMQTIMDRMNIPGGGRIIDVVVDTVKIGAGQLPACEFEKRCGTLIVHAGGNVVQMLGSSSGLGAARAFFSKKGAITGIKAVAQNIGKTNAICIAAMAIAVAVKTGIERPYRDLVKNTETVKDAAKELERISGNFYNHQILFTKYLEADAQMETELKGNMSRVDKAGQNALDAICKI